MTTSAETLRAAAERLRSPAADATEGPWFAEHLEAAWGEEHDAILIGQGKPLATLPYDHNGHLNADWIAVMHPGVGNALAELLENAAATAEGLHGIFADSDDPAEFVHPDALAVARAILGSQP